MDDIEIYDIDNCTQRTKHYDFLVNNMKQRVNRDFKLRKRSNSETKSIGVFKSFLRNEYKHPILGRSTSMTVNTITEDGLVNGENIKESSRIRRHTESKDAGILYEKNVFRRLSIRKLQCIYKDKSPVKDNDFKYLKIIKTSNNETYEKIPLEIESTTLFKKCSLKRQILRARKVSTNSMDTGIFRTSIDKLNENNEYISIKEKESVEIIYEKKQPKKILQRKCSFLRENQVYPPISTYAIQEKRNTITFQSLIS